jgi:pimeloyl-ACP methyl ester carboxylesterase
MPTTERSLRLGTGPVRYLEAGTGSPVVLLHAFPLSADMWRPQLDAAPDGWRILAPDLRGLGPSPAPPAASLDDMAEDVLAWLDGLGIARAAIGGLSMGGYLTFALFRRAPERFTAAMLANTKATADTPDARAARDAMSALVREKGAPAIADQMLPKLLGRTSQEARPDLARLVRATIEANTAEGIDGAIQALKSRPDSTAQLATMTCPSLIVHGEEDAIIPRAEAEAMHRLLPRSELVGIPDAGHLSSLETPAAFSGALHRFLRGLR